MALYFFAHVRVCVPVTSLCATGTCMYRLCLSMRVRVCVAPMSCVPPSCRLVDPLEALFPIPSSPSIPVPSSDLVPDAHSALVPAAVQSVVSPSPPSHPPSSSSAPPPAPAPMSSMQVNRVFVNAVFTSCLYSRACVLCCPGSHRGVQTCGIVETL